MKQVKVINIDGWMQKLGLVVGILLLRKPKEKLKFDLPLAEKEIHNRILLRVMCSISTDLYESEWEEGLEYDLWQQASANITEDGMCLHLLAERAGGWWIWSESSNKPEFISIRNWRAHYDNWSRKWKVTTKQDV